MSSLSLKARETEQRENRAPLQHVKVMTNWSHYSKGQRERSKRGEQSARSTRAGRHHSRAIPSRVKVAEDFYSPVP